MTNEQQWNELNIKMSNLIDGNLMVIILSKGDRAQTGGSDWNQQISEKIAWDEALKFIISIW